MGSGVNPASPRLYKRRQAVAFASSAWPNFRGDFNGNTSFYSRYIPGSDRQSPRRSFGIHSPARRNLSVAPESSRHSAETFRRRDEDSRRRAETPQRLPQALGEAPRPFGGFRDSSAYRLNHSPVSEDSRHSAETSRQTAETFRRIDESLFRFPRVLGGAPKPFGNSPRPFGKLPRVFGALPRVSRTCRR